MVVFLKFNELKALENAYQTTGKTFQEPSPEEQLRAEIERLRKQGSKQLAEDQENICIDELAKEKEQLSSIGPVKNKEKMKCNC